jgi:hypothetical protein
MKASFEFAGLAVTVSSKFLEYAPAPWQTPQVKTLYKCQWVQIPFDSETKRGYTVKAKADFYGNLAKYPSLYAEKNQPERPYLPAFWEKKRLGEVKSPQPLENNGKHKITVSSEHGRLSFTFWASVSRPDIESESDLLGALNCLASDATCAQGSFEDFCSELGYDLDSRKAYKVYKACLKQKSKLESILGDTDLWDFANAINERENG